MKPSAYISDGGILFKESPPDSMIKLTPLYAMRELTDEEIGHFKGQWYRGDFNSFYDLVKSITKKASEK